jgi:hypothetical protein
MRVFVPNPLHSYTSGRAEVEGTGASLAELLADLDRRYPGFRFRIIDEQNHIRPHIRFFVNGEMARSISHPISPGEDVQIICALSGG